MVPLLWAALKPPITATVFAVMIMHGSMREFFLKTLYIYYTTGWQLQTPAVVLLCSRKRGSIFFALKTLHIYYTTQIA